MVIVLYMDMKFIEMVVFMDLFIVILSLVLIVLNLSGNIFEV